MLGAPEPVDRAGEEAEPARRLVDEPATGGVEPFEDGADDQERQDPARHDDAAEPDRTRESRAEEEGEGEAERLQGEHADDREDERVFEDPRERRVGEDGLEFGRAHEGPVEARHRRDRHLLEARRAVVGQGSPTGARREASARPTSAP